MLAPPPYGRRPLLREIMDPPLLSDVDLMLAKDNSFNLRCSFYSGRNSLYRGEYGFIPFAVAMVWLIINGKNIQRKFFDPILIYLDTKYKTMSITDNSTILMGTALTWMISTLAIYT